VCSSKFVPFRPFAEDVGQTEFMQKCVCDVLVLCYLCFCVFKISMAGVCLEEMDFSYADECSCLFCFVAKRVDDLIDFEWQVGVTTYPETKDTVHGRFACRS